MAHIVEHLPIAELERRYRRAEDATEARHIQAIWLLAQGRTVLDVAGVLAFAPRWVEELAARYNAHGPEALGDQRRRNGRAASVLTKAVLEALSERLRTPPDSGGSFGVKQGVFPYIVLMAAAARVAGRPVKWIEDRLEHLAASVCATNRATRLEAAVEANGRVTALAWDQVEDCGAHLRAPEPATRA